MIPSPLSHRAREWLEEHTALPAVQYRDALTSLLESVRREAMEQAATVARDAATEFMSDRDTYVLRGPAGLVHSIIAAVRTLAAQKKEIG